MAKLAARGVGLETAEQVLAELAAESYQSDARYAGEHARSLIERGYGPLRIEAELRARGIDPAVIRQCTDAEDPIWIERLSEVYARRFGAGVPADPRERARRCRFLLGRGFAAAAVRRFLGPFQDDAGHE